MVTELHPAVLPGTVKDFPIKADELIAMAKRILLEEELGKNDDSVLADDFRFEFPIVKLDKKGYLKAIRTFDFKEGFPNYMQNAYDWRVDAYEPQRVWCTIRVTGTHSGTLKIFNKYSFKPTGINVYGAPEAFSITFNEQGKATSVTGGYVMDNRLGNTNKLGALFGLLSAIGAFVPHPQPGTWGWTVGVAVDTGLNLVRSTFHFFTLSIFKSKPKIE